MITLLHRFALLTFPLLLTNTAVATRGEISAGGIIKVRGADASLVLVTVVPSDAPAYSLPIGTKAFTLSLPLDAMYLIRVERQGCPSKEVYVDATVPAEYHAGSYRFPFLVTLEHRAPERMFAYDGPVGFVRYMHALKGFGYETNYAVRMDQQLTERMVAVRATGVDPKDPTPNATGRAVDLPRGSYSAPAAELGGEMSGMAPMVSEVPRLVHVVSIPGPDPDPGALLVPTPRIMAAIPSTVPAAAMALKIAPVETVSLSVRTAAPPVPRAIAPRQRPTTTGKPMVDRAPTTSPDKTSFAGREEELIVEPRRVTHLLRLRDPSGAVTEFRKVTHAFGASFYFQNSGSITERAYEEAISK